MARWRRRPPADDSRGSGRMRATRARQSPLRGVVSRGSSGSALVRSRPTGSALPLLVKCLDGTGKTLAWIRASFFDFIFISFGFLARSLYFLLGGIPPSCWLNLWKVLATPPRRDPRAESTSLESRYQRPRTEAILARFSARSQDCATMPLNPQSSEPRAHGTAANGPHGPQRKRVPLQDAGCVL